MPHSNMAPDPQRPDKEEHSKPYTNTLMAYTDKYALRLMTDGTSTYAELVQPDAGMFGEDIIRGVG